MSTKKIQILNSMTSGTVHYDVAQELTKEEMAQARNNINAASLDESGKIPLEQLPDDIVNSSDLNDYYTKTEIDEVNEGFEGQLSAKADLVDGKIPTEQLPDNIGGGVTSWNDLTDKPFSESGWSIEYDGTPTDESKEIGEFAFNKVSNLSFTKEEIIGANVGFGTEVVEITEDNIVDCNEYCYFVTIGEIPACLVVSQATEFEFEGWELSFSSASVWFIHMGENGYTNYLGKGEIKTLDEKYIPYTIARKSDVTEIDLSGKADLVDGKVPLEQLPDNIGSGLTEVAWEDIKNKPFGEMGIKIEWDGDITDKEHLGIVPGFDFYRISSKPLSEEELLGTSISTYYSGGFMEGVISQDGAITISPTTNGNLIVMYAGQLPMLFVSSQVGEDSAFGQTFNVESTGVWFLHSIGEDEYTYYIEKDYSIKKIDKELLPDDIGGSGGVTSWNDLEDKPFGEDGWAAIWDGNPETALEEPFLVDAMGAIVYKISTETPSKEECVGSYVRYALSGEEIISTIESTQPTDSEDCFVLMGDGMGLFAVALKDGSYNFMGIPFVLTAGIWSVVVGGAYTPLQLGETSIMKIDEKYLPDNIGGGVTEVSWEDIKDKPFGSNGWEFTYDESQTYESFSVPTMGATLYKIGEAKTKDELIGATGRYILGGSEEEFVIDESSFQDCTDNRAFVIMGNTMGLFAVSSEAIATEFMGISFEFPSAGTWNVCVDGAYTPTYLGNVVIKKIDAKYLPINLDGSVSLDNYYTKAETDSLIEDIDVDVDLSNYYTKSETDDLIGNADNIGSNISDCPTYTGGQILSADDVMIVNLYKTFNSVTADGQFDLNNAIYNINTNEFVITFKSDVAITSNNYIVVNIATGFNSTSASEYIYTSDLSVELNTRNLSQNCWYTAYCVYNEVRGKMVGYLISTSANADTDVLQTKSNLVTSIDQNSTDEQYPSAKLLYDIIGDCDIILEEINTLIGE